MLRFIPFLLLGAAASACGSSLPPPSDKLASAESASRSAVEVGAQSEPQASLYLKMANDQIEQAKATMKSGDNDEATRLLARANADAELALQLAKEATTRTQASAAAAKVEDVKAGRGTP